MREKDGLNLEVDISKTPNILEVKWPKIGVNDTIKLWDNLSYSWYKFQVGHKKAKLGKGFCIPRPKPCYFWLNLDYSLFIQKSKLM